MSVGRAYLMGMVSLSMPDSAITAPSWSNCPWPAGSRGRRGNNGRRKSINFYIGYLHEGSSVEVCEKQERAAQSICLREIPLTEGFSKFINRLSASKHRWWRKLYLYQVHIALLDGATTCYSLHLSIRFTISTGRQRRCKDKCFWKQGGLMWKFDYPG
ncbi:hypothetical protein Bbelb_139680 [Branchiostoma belcheri]|nr:hypothetical protein Bbelb_139680 [Branchiostoma belcheri]